MIPSITVFEHSPDRGRGLARDMGVRWACEEVGQPYHVRLVSSEAMKGGAHRALNPFGQIPTYQDGDLSLFDSGAIVSTSPSGTPACCRPTPRRAPARSCGCSPP